MLSYIQSSQLFLDVITTYTLLLRLTLYTTHFPKHLLSEFQFFFRNLNRYYDLFYFSFFDKNETGKS